MPNLQVNVICWDFVVFNIYLNEGVLLIVQISFPFSGIWIEQPPHLQCWDILCPHISCYIHISMPIWQHSFKWNRILMLASWKRWLNKSRQKSITSKQGCLKVAPYSIPGSFLQVEYQKTELKEANDTYAIV